MSKRRNIESAFARKNISLPRTAIRQGNELAKKQGRTFSNLLAMLLAKAYKVSFKNGEVSERAE